MRSINIIKRVVVITALIAGIGGMLEGLPPLIERASNHFDESSATEAGVVGSAFAADATPLPVANAGPDRTVTPGRVARLDGGGSTDPAAATLTYTWSIASKPGGSLVSLSSTSAVRPNITIDVPGDYVFELTVRSGSRTSAPDRVTLSTINSAPLADAGPDQVISIGQTVRLDGTRSSDWDGDALDSGFTWAIVSAPAGSTAVLNDPTATRPTFVASVAGDYVTELVVDDGLAESSPDRVTVSTGNVRPVPDAGPDQRVSVGQRVYLDGSGSTDANGELISYSWTLLSRPAGSTAAVSTTADLLPSFVADVAGTYVAQLSVNEGSADEDGNNGHGNDPDHDDCSNPGKGKGNHGADPNASECLAAVIDTVVITTAPGNSLPVANAGADQTVALGSIVTLDGGASSDIDGNALTYRWAMVGAPSGSADTLSDATAVRPTFLAVAAGTYVFQLIVEDGTDTSLPDTVLITTANSAPIANAGPDQAFTSTGVAAALTGAASRDADNDPLAYKWALLRRPSQSTAALANPTTVTPGLTLDRTGIYVAQLIVSDPTSASDPDTVVLTTGNARPVANAGPDQSRLRGTVQLDGSVSTDANGAAGTYRWALLSKPAGSTATLSSTTSAATSFTGDVVGLYVAQLIVADAKVESAPDTVVIEILNQAPIADAGADQTVPRGSTVQLNGAASSDPEGDPLTYAWSFVSAPSGSTATLSNAATVTPSFIADRAGMYVVQLTVNDGLRTSAPDTVQVTVPNEPPVADAGDDRTVAVDSLVELDGSGSSDPDGDPLTYAWTFSIKPPGSTVSFTNAAAANPSFVPDVPGAYVIQLVVNDGEAPSPVDEVVITARNVFDNAAPELAAIGDDSVSLGTTLSLQLSATDAEGDPLQFTATPLPLPAGATLTTAGVFTFTPSIEQVGAHILTFHVSDGIASDSETITITVLEVPAGGVTAYTARLLDADAAAQGDTVPVVGATLSFLGSGITTTSDAEGYFTLTGIPAGTQQLSINAATAQPGPGSASYAGYPATVSVIGGTTNQAPQPFYLPRVAVSTPINPSVTTTVSALGVTVTIPRNAAKLNGANYTGAISLAEMPTSLPLNILPPFLEPCRLFAIQPLGVTFTPAVAVTLPNFDNLPAGSEVDLWQLDPTTGDFGIVGTGTVNAAGTQITTTSGGMTAAGLITALPPAAKVAASADNNSENLTPSALNDGDVVTSYTLPSYSSLGQDRALTFVYNSFSADPAPIVAADATILSRATLPAVLESRLEVGGVEVAGPVFTTTGTPANPGDPALSESVNETLRQAILFDAGTLATGSYPYTLTTTTRYACSAISAVSTGQVLVNNQAESPFGSGWTLQELQQLTQQPNGRVVIAEGDGTILAFSPFVPVGTTGAALEVRAPAAVSAGSFESNGEIQVIAEQQNVALAQAMAISTVRPILHDAAGDLIATTLQAGTLVSSHIVHFDPVGTGTATATGSVTFTTDILGLVVRDADLAASDGLVGLADVTYPASARQVELATPADTITVSADLRTITVNLGAGADIDQIRVITAGAGEEVVASGFDSGLDGWTVSGDVASGPTFVATGGNPGGYLSAVDAAVGDVWYWHAAPQFVGDKQAFYGGLLAFDLRQSSTSVQFNSDDVRLVGANMTLVYNTPYNPGTGFTHYAVVLKEGAGWTVQGAGRPATAAEMRAVLASLTTLQIRGEYRTGADTGAIDNVELVDLTGELPAVADFLAPDGDFTTLTRNADGGFTRSYKDGTKVVFNADGLQTAVTDRNGNTTSYSYDAQGRLATVTDPAGLVTALTYGPDGKLASVLDPAGRSTSFLFDEYGNLVRVTDPLSNDVDYAYDSAHRLVAETNERNFTTVSSYGFAGKYLGSDRPDGSSVATNIARDLGLADLGIGIGTSGNPAGFVRTGPNTATFTDARGNPLTATLNEFGSPIEITDAIGRTTILTHDANDLVTRVQAPSDGQLPDGTVPGTVMTEFDYDANGNVLAQREAVGTSLQRQTSFEYEPAFNQVTKITDPAGFPTRFEYDAKGNQTKIIDALNGEQIFTYNAQGLRLTARDQNGNLTKYAYDTRGNLADLTDALNNVTLYVRDAAGNETARVEGAGTPEQRRIEMAYDAKNRILTETDGTGETTTHRYDAVGNTIEIIDPTGVIEVRTYDPTDRLVAVNHPANGTVQRSYDDNSNVLSETDPHGERWRYEYDAVNRLIKTVDPLNGERLFSHDAQDNVITVRDANSNVTTFAYDVLRRNIRRANAVGEAWRFSYDGRDNLIDSVSPATNNTATEYDALSRVSRAVTPEDTLVYTYDANGNLLSAADDDSRVAFSYDGLDRQVSATTADGSTYAGAIQPAVTLTYAYDSVGNRIQLLDSLGGTTTYAYDRVGRVTGITSPGSNTLDFDYDPAGRVTQIDYPNGVTSAIAFDAGGRVRSIAHLRGLAELSRFTHSYDLAGNLSTVDEGGGRIRNFAYDEQQRLIASGTAFEPESYNYDAEGNRTSSHLSTVYVTDTPNRLREDDHYCYAYDANGNLASKTEKIAGTCTGGITRYQYDALDQLVRIQFADLTSADYRYDALGRRIERNVGGTIIRYVYDDTDILAEFDGANALLARYTHGQSVDQPLVMEADEQSFFYHADHLDSIRLLTDSAGNVANSYSYDAYGGFVSVIEQIPNPYTYTGREYDPESGLYYYRARYYDAGSGRLLSEDPSGFQSGDLNLYRYTGNNPANWADPSGLARRRPGTGKGRVGGAAGEYASSALDALELAGSLSDVNNFTNCTLFTLAGTLNMVVEAAAAGRALPKNIAVGLSRDQCGITATDGFDDVGNKVHNTIQGEVSDEFRADRPIGGGSGLKPDGTHRKKNLCFEIKPLTESGIRAANYKVGLYKLAFHNLGRGAWRCVKVFYYFLEDFQ